MKFKKSATTKVMTVPARENHLKFVSNIQNFPKMGYQSTTLHSVDLELIKIILEWTQLTVVATETPSLILEMTEKFVSVKEIYAMEQKA